MAKRIFLTILAILVVGGGIAVALLSSGPPPPVPGHVLDEAMQAGVTADKLKGADDDYFSKMDGGIKLTPEEIRGRNNWIVWTAGNDRMWDQLSKDTFGGLDFLKTLSSHAGLKFSRATRWNYFGLVNEPCFEQATAPDPERWGLWLDKRITNDTDCKPDPYADETKYPGVKIGARGATLPFYKGGTKLFPVGSYYGYPTGVIGVRLFPNPAFDEAAAKKWDPDRYYNDPNYYNSKDLVKPYRVGMSCGFCHVGPSPINPPADPENPKWENLSSVVGAQYYWVDRLFLWQADPASLIFQVFHTSRPGSLDTSAISTDNINNPRTMNAIYNLRDRLELAKRFGQETLAGGGLDNKQFNDYVSSGWLTDFYKPPATVFTPKVLKDGADSVGGLGALNRVFVNIGLFSEEWLLHFRPFIGGKTVTPFEIKVARQNSSYWNATEAQTPDLAQFLLAASKPDHLADAPGGPDILKQDEALRDDGKKVFADTCARCHSSKVPDLPPAASPAACAGPGYLKCWAVYWAYTKTPEFKDAMEKIVMDDHFLDHNFLSTDLRVPVTLMKTNACSPLATNGIAQNIWDNFTSESYKTLPPVGIIKVRDPFTGDLRDYTPPGGGRGYTRPASLISLWSTAPFFLNNTLGPFDPSPSVNSRLGVFDKSIHMLLWPETRDMDPQLKDKGVYVIDRTTADAYLTIPGGFLPGQLKPLLSWLDRLLPGVFGTDEVKIGPIPKGTPVGLIANLMVLPESDNSIDPVEHTAKLLALLIKLKHDLAEIPAGATGEATAKVFANLKGPLLELSKCPDFEVNRGHYFGTALDTEGPPLTDQQKASLIAFLKTF